MGQICHNAITNKGIFVKEINLTYRQILWIFLFSQIIFVLPFIIADLVLTSNYYDDCLLANFFCQDLQSTCPIVTVPFTLGMWLVIDGVTKMVVLMTMNIFLICQNSTAQKQIAVALSGNILRGFYLFELGWTIVGSILFWGDKHGFPKETYTYCSHRFKNYLFFLLIYTYVIIPINIFISSLRPKDRDELNRNSIISNGSYEPIKC